MVLCILNKQIIDVFVEKMNIFSNQIDFCSFFDSMYLLNFTKLKQITIFKRR